MAVATAQSIPSIVTLISPVVVENPVPVNVTVSPPK